MEQLFWRALIYRGRGGGAEGQTGVPNNVLGLKKYMVFKTQ